MSTRAITPTVALAVPAFAPLRGGVLQRSCDCGQHTGSGGECDDCKKKEMALQRLSNGDVGPGIAANVAPPIVAEVLRSAGQPLDAQTRAFFEPRLGQDFSRVRVHTDDRAVASARAVQALAYTVGNNVVFGAGQYSPSINRGKRLLAHELTHVVQQAGSGSGNTGPITVRNDRNSELEADRASGLITEPTTEDFSRAQSATTAVPGGSLQRQEWDQDPKAQKATPTNTGTPAPAADCLQELAGRDLEGVFRLDTITVVKLGAKFCGPCKTLARILDILCKKHKSLRHPFRVQYFSIDTDPMEDNGEQITTPEAEENRKLGKKFGAPPIPHTLIFVERELKHNTEGFLGPVEVYEKIIGDIIDDASSSGAAKWGKAGLHLGLGNGALGWLATFLLAPVALVAGGAGLVLGALFGKEKGTKELSKERMAQVMAFNQGKVSEKDLDHGLAEDVIDFWVDHRETFKLGTDQRGLLIKNLVAGSTGDAEERAIIKILENSTDSEILQIFSQANPDLPNLVDLAGEFHGEEREYLDQLLLRLRGRFPVNPPTQKTAGLLIDSSFVQGVLADAFRRTQQHDPGKAAPARECGGVFISSSRGSGMEKEVECVEGTSVATGQIAREAIKKRGNGFKVAGSFHTHPIAEPPRAREAPSGADIKSFVQDPARGDEHYVVGPLVTYLITRDGSVRLLGTTADLLHVERIKPKAGQVSTLELG